MNNASVSSVEKVSPGQMQEINAAILRGAIPFHNRLRPNDAQRFVGSPDLVREAVAKALGELLPKRMLIPGHEAERWQKYYRDWYGITADFTTLEIPAETGYPTRLIVMHEWVSNSPQCIATVYRKRCTDKWWQFADDLDTAVPTHARSGTYALRVADVAEAPDGFENGRNLSSQDVWDRGWLTTTLPERLIDGDMYLLEKEVHLDQKVVTLCAGSRNSGGDVPSVYLRGGGGVEVFYWLPGFAFDLLRFRRAIV